MFLLRASLSETSGYYYYYHDIPSNIRLEGGHLWVEFLVATYEGIFVDLPDLPIVVPRAEVAL